MMGRCWIPVAHRESKRRGKKTLLKYSNKTYVHQSHWLTEWLASPTEVRIMLLLLLVPYTVASSSSSSVLSCVWCGLFFLALYRSGSPRPRRFRILTWCRTGLGPAVWPGLVWPGLVWPLSLLTAGWSGIFLGLGHTTKVSEICVWMVCVLLGVGRSNSINLIVTIFLFLFTFCLSKYYHYSSSS